ncbi:hypothetical protein CEXT_416201 [Caerostris extrusa]|uniref:Uncharacterized protein n=1 Tax=Caerostris extrusa TaxID=172846 RepID=A0AAV4MVH9_CAEEX|nr:hypothetical protein CEXT_416201 [Caerostris extrusa]
MILQYFSSQVFGGSKTLRGETVFVILHTSGIGISTCNCPAISILSGFVSLNRPISQECPIRVDTNDTSTIVKKSCVHACWTIEAYFIEPPSFKYRFPEL